MNHEKYQCSNCGACHCKLWREVHSYDDKLYCVKCGTEKEGKNPTDVDDEGKIKWFHKGVEMGMTDQLGGLLPAVPTPDGSSFYGYSVVPDAGVEWWKNLPTRMPTARLDLQRRLMTNCQSDDDGECNHKDCPQLRDKEPAATGRHCPWDKYEEE